MEARTCIAIGLLLFSFHLAGRASGNIDFPKAQDVTWSSYNFKTLLSWGPKPTDYSYTVEFYGVGKDRERNPHCIRTKNTDCDLTRMLTDLKETYYADVLSEPERGATSDIVEFPHTRSERFCPYKDTLIGRPDFKIDVDKAKNKIVLYIKDPISAIYDLCLQWKGEGENKGGEEEKEPTVPSVRESEETVILDDDLENRRSPRVKTTPLRRQAESKCKPVLPPNTQCESTKAETSNTLDEEEPLEDKGDVSSRIEDSDSDEVPAILLQAAAMMPSSGESESGGEASPQSVKKQCLFGLKKDASPSPEKVAIAQRIQTRPSKHNCKKVLTRKSIQKRRQSGSDSTSGDSDLEKEITNLSSLGATKRRPHKPKKLKSEVEEFDEDDGEEEMSTNKVTGENRISTSKPVSRLRKDNRTEEQSSSGEEEGQDAYSGDDSDDQKMKPITEMAVLGAGSFLQSSGEEVDMTPGPRAAADDDDDDPENS